MPFDPHRARSLVPAVRDASGRVFLDGPGGTQAPEQVIAAIAATLRRGQSNLGGAFATSVEADEVVRKARIAVADFFNASRPEEIVFGQNMTSLTMAVSRAIARTWAPGDDIVLTGLDHDANVWPWVLAAREKGVSVAIADFDPDRGCVLPVDAVASLLTPRTRLVAVTHASNALGTIVDVGGICAAARDVGAMTYVDAVHYAPYGPIDVAASRCDFLVASAYKFYGPHTGVLYGRHDALSEIEPFKVRPAPDEPPSRWESGTQSTESLAGVTAAVDYLASWGEGETRRARRVDAMAGIVAYERSLSERLLAAVAETQGLSVVGRDDAVGRTPTFGLDVAGVAARDAAARLAALGIFTWAGDHYATEVMARLGRTENGLLRIGMVHYNLAEEVDAALDAVGEMAAVAS